MAGSSENSAGGFEVAIWRYTTSGTLDTAFGSSAGYIVSGSTGAAGATGASEVDKGAALYIDSSDNYVIGGTSANTNAGQEATIWRYTNTGALDLTFNTTGYSCFGATGATGTTGSAEVDIPTAMRVDGSGNFVLVGKSANSSSPAGNELAIWRFTSAGAVDTSLSGTFVSGAVVFGGTGAAGATGSNENDVAHDLQISDAEYVIVGSSANGSSGNELVMWRYTNAGALDTTFNSSGYVVSGTTGTAGATGSHENDEPMALVVDSSGRYVMPGTSENGANGKEMVLWRYTSTGTLDTSLNSTGYLLFGTTGAAGATGASENDSAFTLRIDSKGRFVLSGSSTKTGGGAEGAMWRFLSTGILEI